MGIGNRQTEQGKSQLVFVDVLDPSRDNAGKIGKLLLTTPAGTEALRQYICRTWSFDKSVELNHDGVGQVLFASGRLTVPASMVKDNRSAPGKQFVAGVEVKFIGNRQTEQGKSQLVS